MHRLRGNYLLQLLDFTVLLLLYLLIYINLALKFNYLTFQFEQILKLLFTLRVWQFYQRFQVQTRVAQLTFTLYRN